MRTFLAPPHVRHDGVLNPADAANRLDPGSRDLIGAPPQNLWRDH